MSSAHDPPSQSFRCRSTDEVVDIPARLNPKTGEYIILWKDIQDGFEDVKSIRNGTSLVPFIVDDNFEQITPLRIAHYPGVVLEVIVRGRDQIGSSGNISCVAGSTSVGHKSKGPKNDFSLQQPHEDIHHTNTLALNLTALADEDTPVINATLAVHSKGMSEGSQMSLHAYSQHYHSYFQAIASGQETQATNIMQSMDHHFDRLQKGMDKNRALQEQLVQMQQEILGLQQQTLERLAIIQDRVQGLITQTYELHEYPIPRLFIVLPMTERRRGKFMKPFSDQYRLFFLCECGSHTMMENTKLPHEIHLAKHEGYELEKPTEFFEKYGNYILTLMYMVKFGIAASGLVVSPLSNLKILDGLDATEDYVKFLKSNITPLVDDTIRALKGNKDNGGMNTELDSHDRELDKVEALEGADLRQLESYLKIKDQAWTLGNLFRIVTAEGHVKWVCLDHYRANYRESMIQQLRDVVEFNSGRYIEEISKIEITIGSSILAKQFYEAAAKARGIQELEIMLKWDVTMEDLRNLAKTVTKANVVHLTLDGTHFKGPTLDVVNRGRRFDPILQLASNGRIQSLHLKGFDDFYSRTTKSSLVPAPNLRGFSLQSGVLSTEKFNSLSSYLDYCAGLTKLELKLYEQQSLAGTMTDIISRLPKLETFKMDLNEMSFDAAISQNRIQELTVTIERVNLSHEAFKIVPRDCLTRLAILRTPQGLEHGLLRDIICSSPRLSHLQLGCLGRQASELIGLVRDARKTTFHGGPGLLTFELMDEKLTPFDTLGDSDDYEHHIYCIVSFSEDSDSFEMRSWVRLMNGMFPHRDEPIQNFLRRYGWSIVYLDEGYSNMDTIIAATENDITRREESRIESFVLNADKLTTGSFEGPKAIERHAPKFKELGLYITVESSAQLGLAQQLLQEHVSTLFRMQLAVLKEYLSRIITTCPARREYPKLVSFELYFIVGSRCPSDCLSWIVAMISPPPRAASLSSTSLDLQTVVHCRSGAEDSWTALRKIALCNINFQPEEWKLVIEAIDFDELQHFDLRGSNFSQQQFRLLMDRIPDNRIPLKTLGISSSLAKNAQVVSMVAELQKKAPLVTVIKA